MRDLPYCMTLVQTAERPDRLSRGVYRDSHMMGSVQSAGNVAVMQMKIAERYTHVDHHHHHRLLGLIT
jgi:hypothetical protein